VNTVVITSLPATACTVEALTLLAPFLALGLTTLFFLGAGKAAVVALLLSALFLLAASISASIFCFDLAAADKIVIESLDNVVQAKNFAHLCFNVVKSCIAFATHFFFGFGDLLFDHTDDQLYQ
jgi:hypothetical protein